MPYSGVSDALESFMTKRAATARQAMLDAITVRKEDRLEQHDNTELEIKRETLQDLRDNRHQTQADKMAAAAQGVADKELASYTKKIGMLQPGDFIDKPLQDQGARLGVPPPMNPGEVKTIPAAQSAPVLPQAPDPSNPVGDPEKPAILPGAQPQMALRLAPTFAGTPQQREAEAKRARIQTLMDSLPEGPEKKDMEVYLATGTHMAAGGFKPEGPKAPELGTFGDYLSRVSGGHPETLQASQIETARKKWGDENRATPREPNPQPQIFTDPKGVTHAIQFVGGVAQEIPLPEGLHKGAIPGSSQIAAQTANKVTAGHAVTRLEQDIEDADKAGLLGPAAGRFYEMLAKAGTTGDDAKDRMIGRIKGDILLTKMHVDAGIGGARAASSPLLLKNWEDLALHGSKNLLLGYTSGIKDDLATGSDTPPSTGSGIKSITLVSPGR